MVPSITELSNVHKGETIVVIAAGPSAAGTNFSDEEKGQFRAAITIGVNHPIDWIDPTYLARYDGVNLVDKEHPHYLLYLYAAEAMLKWRIAGTTKTILGRDRWEQYGGILKGYEPDYEFLKVPFVKACREPGGFPVRQTTTTGAVWLAVKMGATRIIIIGLDLQFVEPPPDEEVFYKKRSARFLVKHHYDHLFDMVPQGRFKYEGISTEFERLQAEARKAGHEVEVINANPDSLCTSLPKRDIHELLAEMLEPAYV